MSVFRAAEPSGAASVAMQPTPLDDKSRDSERQRSFGAGHKGWSSKRSGRPCASPGSVICQALI
jgi:hypothetical protein